MIKLHAIDSRILANLLVELSRTLVNLLVKKAKLARMNPMGAMGGRVVLGPSRPWANPPRVLRRFFEDQS